MHRTDSSCDNSPVPFSSAFSTFSPFLHSVSLSPLIHVDVLSVEGQYMLNVRELLDIYLRKLFSRCILITNKMHAIMSEKYFRLIATQIAISIYKIMLDQIIGLLWAVFHGIKCFLWRVPRFDHTILLALRATHIFRNISVYYFTRDRKLHPVLI